ncbi:unnamed protein product [Trichogramma brassicae]|uniref:Uncharacterized protein n=1 Tax=Trichogramma brassicae TaxID=86971 RepID=A0A6H5I5G8_9HYME|nr:unnamed protein product [Trichogramma brassicae]
MRPEKVLFADFSGSCRSSTASQRVYSKLALTTGPISPRGVLDQISMKKKMKKETLELKFLNLMTPDCLDQERISTSCGESGGPALGRCVCELYAPTRPPGLRSSRFPSTGYSAGSDRITISRSPRRGLTKLAIDGAQHSHDEVRSENHTHKRAPDAGAKAQLERMMTPEARTTLTR